MPPISPIRSKFRPENFFTRNDQLKQVKFPKSSSHMLVIRPNSEVLGFLSNSYNEKLLCSRLERSVFQNTITNANKICESVWKKKRMLEEKDELYWLDYLMYMAFFFIFIGTLCVIEYAEEEDNSYLLAGFVSFLMTGTIVISVMLINVMKKPRFIKMEETIYLRLKEYFEAENENVYKALNMVWIVQERFFWLELYMDRFFRRVH